MLAALSFFAARDDATTAAPEGPGTAVPARSGALGTDLRAGNVQLRYGNSAARAAAARLARDLSGGPSAQLTAAGQSVHVVPEPGLSGIRAIAWRRELHAIDPGDPALRAFVEHWLGRGVQAE